MASRKLSAADIPFRPGSHDLIKTKQFTTKGEGRYTLAIEPAGIVFEVDRLRRHSHELVGELSVSVNGSFPSAKTVEGFLTVGDLNFSSVQARSTRSKLLIERCGDSSLVDWYGLLEEFILKVVQSERDGRPLSVLADVEERDEKVQVWMVDHWPVLADLPMVLFGDSDSGKSYYAMYVAGSLAQQGHSILYCDWEFSENEHRVRFGRLFQPMPKNLYYIRCDRPLVHETDRIVRLIREHKCNYVICDSIGFAVDGPAESQEGAAAYFRAIRQLGVGSLNIAHTPKRTEEGQDAQIFGSTFFRAGARSVWFIDATRQTGENWLKIALHHRKSNVGNRLKPQGYQFTFERAVTHVQQIDPELTDELAAGLPLVDRIKRMLRTGPMMPKDIADDLNASPGAVRGTISRHASQFIKVGKRVALRGEDVEI